MKKIGLMLAGMIALCGVVSAEVLYLDLGNASGSTYNGYGAAYGSNGTWNIITSTSTINLIDFAGLATDVDMTISSPGTVEMNGWSASSLPVGMEQLLADNFWVSSATWTVSLTGLAGNLYDIYVYAPSHPSVNTGDFTVNGTAVSSIPGSTDTTFIEGVNYKRVQNIAASGGALTLSSVSPVGFSGVAGLQIVAIPEPATALILALGGGLIGLYRRFFGRV